ncbi:MAG: glycosyltransferase family 2 protein [Planctomycetota bacterium]|nr:MAG: glycosyltransferase family 2 protein [Planctomycetota bacterium]
MKLSIVIPVYNEKQTVRTILERVMATSFDKEIVMVDDGSTDGTREVLKELQAEGHPGLHIYMHDVNQGKGAALRTGFSKVSGDVVLIQDADLEYTPEDYPALLKPIQDGLADVVYGSRFLGGGTHRCHLFWHYVVNKGLTLFSNMLTNLNLTDMETCYKVFRRDVVDRIKIESNRFGVEPEMTAKIARMTFDGAKVRIYEVPISYFGRDFAEGKKIGVKDGFQAIWCILKFNLF